MFQHTLQLNDILPIEGWPKQNTMLQCTSPGIVQKSILLCESPPRGIRDWVTQWLNLHRVTRDNSKDLYSSLKPVEILHLSAVKCLEQLMAGTCIFQFWARERNHSLPPTTHLSPAHGHLDVCQVSLSQDVQLAAAWRFYSQKTWEKGGNDWFSDQLLALRMFYLFLQAL